MYGVQPCQVLGWTLAFGSWILNKELHAILTPSRPEWQTRPRCHVVTTGESGVGKSPWYESACSPCFTSRKETSLVDSNRSLFSTCCPKGHIFASGTDADFAARMHDSGGTLMLISDESTTVLHADFLTGASRSKDASKVDLASILSTQNGGAFGPKSIKSEGLRLCFVSTFHTPLITRNMQSISSTLSHECIVARLYCGVRHQRALV